MVEDARLFVRSPEAAADVVQETWLGAVRGLDRFEGRASVRTWIFRILLNRARSRGQRDGHWITFSALAGREAARGPAAIDPAEFSDDLSSWPGHWVREPRRWAASAEEELRSAELLRHVSAPGGISCPECSLLDISGQPARSAAPCATSRSSMTVRWFVEVVTDYLEGVLDPFRGWRDADRTDARGTLET